MDIGSTSELNEFFSDSHADRYEGCGHRSLARCRGRKCCEYHSRFNHTPTGDCGKRACCPEFCIFERSSSDISKSGSDVSKRSGLQLQQLGNNPIAYCLRVIKSIEDNDLSFLKAYLTQYPSHVDGLLPFHSGDGYDDKDTHHSLLQIGRHCDQLTGSGAIRYGRPEKILKSCRKADDTLLLLLE